MRKQLEELNWRMNPASFEGDHVAEVGVFVRSPTGRSCFGFAGSLNVQKRKKTAKRYRRTEPRG